MIVENRKAIYAAITKAMRQHGIRRAKPFNHLLLQPSLTPDEIADKQWEEHLTRCQRLVEREQWRLEFNYRGAGDAWCRWPRWTQEFGPFLHWTRRAALKEVARARERKMSAAELQVWIAAQPKHVQEIHRRVMERIRR